MASAQVYHEASHGDPTLQTPHATPTPPRRMQNAHPCAPARTPQFHMCHNHGCTGLHAKKPQNAQANTLANLLRTLNLICPNTPTQAYSSLQNPHYSQLYRICQEEEQALRRQFRYCQSQLCFHICLGISRDAHLMPKIVSNGFGGKQNIRGDVAPRSCGD